MSDFPCAEVPAQHEGEAGGGHKGLSLAVFGKDVFSDYQGNLSRQAHAGPCVKSDTGGATEIGAQLFGADVERWTGCAEKQCIIRVEGNEVLPFV